MTSHESANEAIQKEEATLSRVVASLNQQISTLIERVDREELRSRELTSTMVATRKDEDRRMLASDEAVSHALKAKGSGDLKTLQRLKDKPYFGRVVLEEEINGALTTIEYRIGSAANTDCRIIDWRTAPLSKLYYEYREGDEYEETIQGREREGLIKTRTTVEIKGCELKRISSSLGNFVKTPNGTWETGNSSSGAGVRDYSQLPNILPMIAADQFRSITDDPHRAVLIQGIAGSGKTAVALHRLAWLLHETNAGVNARKIMIVAESPGLRRYIVKTLMAMDLELPLVTSFAGYFATQIAVVAPQYVEKDEEGAISIIRPTRPLGSTAARVLQSDGLLAAINQLEIKSITGSGEREDPVMVLTSLLLREAKKIVAADTSKLLSEGLVLQVGREVQALGELGCIDRAMDGALANIALRQTGNVVLPSGERGKFQHVIVDEVQDLKLHELAALISSAVQVGDVTFVGDTAQQIMPGSAFPGWNKIRSLCKLEQSQTDRSGARLVTLDVSHRSTLQVMKLADHILGRQLVNTGREGRRPIMFHTAEEEAGVTAAINWLKLANEKYPTALTAVICQNREEMRQVYRFLQPAFGPALRSGADKELTFDEGVIVLEVTQAKGLEFTNVLIWNPNRKTYAGSDLDRNLLYVGVTRAEENVALVFWGDPSPLLPHFDSPLIRYHPVDLESEEDDDNHTEESERDDEDDDSADRAA